MSIRSNNSFYSEDRKKIYASTPKECYRRKKYYDPDDYTEQHPFLQLPRNSPTKTKDPAPKEESTSPPTHLSEYDDGTTDLDKGTSSTTYEKDSDTQDPLPEYLTRNHDDKDILTLLKLVIKILRALRADALQINETTYPLIKKIVLKIYRDYEEESKEESEESEKEENDKIVFRNSTTSPIPPEPLAMEEHERIKNTLILLETDLHKTQQTINKINEDLESIQGKTLQCTTTHNCTSSTAFSSHQLAINTETSQSKTNDLDFSSITTETTIGQKAQRSIILNVPKHIGIPELTHIIASTYYHHPSELRFTKANLSNREGTLNWICYLSPRLLKTIIIGNGIQVGPTRCYLRPHTWIKRCRHCQTLGHQERHCPNKAVCENCSQNHKNEDCNLPPTCFNCKALHLTETEYSHKTSDTNCHAYREAYKTERTKLTKRYLHHNETQTLPHSPLYSNTRNQSEPHPTWLHSPLYTAYDQFFLPQNSWKQIPQERSPTEHPSSLHHFPPPRHHFQHPFSCQDSNLNETMP